MGGIFRIYRLSVFSSRGQSQEMPADCIKGFSTADATGMPHLILQL